MQGLARSRTSEPGKGEGAPRGIAEPAEAGTRGILAEQVALLYQGSFVAPVNLLNALIVAAALWNSFPRGVLVAWIGLTALVVGLRLALRRPGRVSGSSASPTETSLYGSDRYPV